MSISNNHLTQLPTSKSVRATLLYVENQSLSQSTGHFPQKQICESLRIEPGNDLLLDRPVETGEKVWFLPQPINTSISGWVACANTPRERPPVDHEPSKLSRVGHLRYSPSYRRKTDRSKVSTKLPAETIP